MRRIAVCALFISISVFAQDNTPSAYVAVDPFIGTAADGNTFPGASLPLGMMQWGPDTRADGWYHYSDKTIRGFSLTHISGAGCSIYADVPILPWIGELKPPADTKKTGSASDFELPFSHAKERARPGYYSIEFDNGAKTELTVAARAGIGRFSFPPGVRPTLIFKAGASASSPNEKRKGDTSTIEIRGNDTIVGTVHSGGFCGTDSNYVLYFAAKFARPFSSSGTWTDMRRPDAPTSGAISATSHRPGAYVSFTNPGEAVLLKVGISFVSVENAAANLQAEIPGWNFDAVHAAAKAAWMQMFDRLQAQGGTPDERTIFYTGLYHMLLSPNIFSDENGDYIGFDSKVRRLGPGEAQYANFSDWDIYRNVVQLQSLLLPDQASQMMQSLVRDAEQSGWLPKWPVANDVSYVMGGDSPAILLSTAHAFGARAFDTKSALRFMVKGATQPGTGLHGQSERPGLDEYLSKGYLSVGDMQESAASITLEYSSADFAVSRFADALDDSMDSVRLLRSAQNWRTLFDTETGFIRPRTADGRFLAGFDPFTLMPHRVRWDQPDQMGFEEGNTWHYTWMIPHNYAGLLQMMGGNQNAVPKLDSFFQKLSGWALPNFTVSNEPDFCTPYAYVWTGNAWKTQAVVERIRRETFAAKPDGLPGNDDLGATSGVYVWNALGMYPVIPGVGGVVLGTPMLSRVTMKLGNGKTLDIVSHGKGIYVHAVNLNGVPRQGAWLPLDALSAQHNKLEFELQSDPDPTWASAPANFPPSFDAPRP